MYYSKVTVTASHLSSLRWQTAGLSLTLWLFLCAPARQSSSEHSTMWVGLMDFFLSVILAKNRTNIGWFYLWEVPAISQFRETARLELTAQTGGQGDWVWRLGFGAHHLQRPRCTGEARALRQHWLGLPFCFPKHTLYF